MPGRQETVEEGDMELSSDQRSLPSPDMDGARPVVHSASQVLGTTRPGYPREHPAMARAAKRAFDLMVAVVLLVILAPALLMIALLIKADSPGPIFFRQRRIGRDGKAFSMLKFRTMVEGADARKPALLHLNEAATGLFKIEQDPRVTHIGRHLRARSMDELPQLLQVVTGTMSLVGPRPLVPEEDAQISGDGRGRLQMRPGITGVWQVAGASAIPIDEMARLDRIYVEEWSPLLDLKLLLRTAWLVLFPRGSLPLKSPEEQPGIPGLTAEESGQPDA